MFPKICAVILAVGAFGCALLAMRQGRLQAASELTQTQLRISKLDKRLWDLRARIADATTPTAIEKMAASVGMLRPMIPDDGTVEPLDPTIATKAQSNPVGEVLHTQPPSLPLKPVTAQHHDVAPSRHAGR